MRARYVCGAFVAVAALLTPTYAAADPTDGLEPPETTTTTTTTAPPSSTAPPPSSTTTTLPGTPPSDLVQPPQYELPPDLPETPFDAGDHHGRQSSLPPAGPWDNIPTGNAQLGTLNAERAEVLETLALARAAVSEADIEVAAARDRLAQLTGAEADAGARHGQTRSRFQRRVAAAYVVGAGPAVRFPTDVDVPAEANRVVLPGAVSEADRALAEKYRTEHEGLSAQARKATEVVAAAEMRADTARRAVAAGEERLASIEAALVEAPEAIAGFVFPIAGPHNFISSFGFCRDGCNRSHQGNDLFAARGTPVVAVEDGWVERISQNRLGGLVVWTRGRSGYRYYYAHLDSYAPGLQAGAEIAAGAYIGGVGDTGNAKGTPPHLHFEIHPGHGPAIDPYRILAGAPVLSAPSSPAPPDTLGG